MLLSLETWIERLAAVLGAFAICMPLRSVWRSRAARRGRRSGPRSRFLHWPTVFLLAIAYVAGGILLWKPLPMALDTSVQFGLTLAGSILYFPGVILYLWGYRSLGSMFAVSSSMAAELYQDHMLVEEGPYAIVRHPMYLGVLLAAFGAMLIFRTVAMVIFTPTALVVIVRAKKEEILLADEFGEQWRSYRDRVPAWLPNPWRKSKSAS